MKSDFNALIAAGAVCAAVSISSLLGGCSSTPRGEDSWRPVPQVFVPAQISVDAPATNDGSYDPALESVDGGHDPSDLPPDVVEDSPEHMSEAEVLSMLGEAGLDAGRLEPVAGEEVLPADDMGPVDGGGTPVALEDTVLRYSAVAEGLVYGKFYDVKTGTTDGQDCATQGFSLLVDAVKAHPQEGVRVHGDCLVEESTGALTGVLAGSFSCERTLEQPAPVKGTRPASYCRFE